MFVSRRLSATVPVWAALDAATKGSVVNVCVCSIVTGSGEEDDDVEPGLELNSKTNGLSLYEEYRSEGRRLEELGQSQMEDVEVEANVLENWTMHVDVKHSLKSKSMFVLGLKEIVAWMSYNSLSIIV